MQRRDTSTGLSLEGGKAQDIAAHGVSGSSQPLPHHDRIQAMFGRHDIGGVQAHMDGPARAATASLGAHGYATGNSVAFAGAPDLHTAAHEAAHVVQQRAGVHLKNGVGEVGDAHERHADAVADKVVHGESAQSLLDQYGGSGGGAGLQFHIRRDHEVVPGMGVLDMDMQAVPSPTPAAGQPARMDGFIHFTPTAGAPNSNVIGITQVIKIANEAQPNSDVPSGTLSPLAQPRGALGQPGLVTDEDPATGVGGGFYNDVLHQNSAAGGGRHAPGTPLSPRYAVEPAGPGVAAWGGTTPGPRGGVGGVGNLSAGGLTPGFKRSDLPEDIRSVAMNDTPGWNSNGDFSFETVVRGEDTNTFYTGVSWGFTTHDGTITHERSAVTAGTSATFNNALDRFRDFYVHEPVVIYFAFDHVDLDAAQTAKIAGLAGYLTRNPQVVMTLDGFADLVGDPAYNVRLSERRVTSVRKAIATTYPAVLPAQVVSNEVVPGRGPTGGHGESTGATDATSEVPAGTGDQGGNAANGGDQNREANRQFNRRVTITFSHPAGTGPAAPGGVGNPAPAAPPPAGP